MGTEENTPIAWVVNGHLLEQGPSGGYIEVKPGGSYSRWEEMPTDAVPLVPATELDEARKVAEWLLAERAHYRSEAETRWVETFDERAEAWKFLDSIAEEIEYDGDHSGLLAAVRKDRTACHLAGRSRAIDERDTALAEVKRLQEFQDKVMSGLRAIPMDVEKRFVYDLQNADLDWGKLLTRLAEDRDYWSAECKKLRAEKGDPYSEVNQQAAAWRAVAEHPVIGPMHALPDRGTYAKSVLARLDQLHEMHTALAEPIFTPVESSQLPVLDTPEALRMAANVIEAYSESTNAHQMFGEPTDRLDWNASDLRAEACRRETAASADAERETRIEEFAEQLYIKHELRVRGDGKWRPWSDILDHTRDLWREEAAALDDLGYRKTGGA